MHCTQYTRQRAAGERICQRLLQVEAQLQNCRLGGGCSRVQHAALQAECSAAPKLCPGAQSAPACQPCKSCRHSLCQAGHLLLRAMRVGFAPTCARWATIRRSCHCAHHSTSFPKEAATTASLGRCCSSRCGPAFGRTKRWRRVISMAAAWVSSASRRCTTTGSLPAL